MDSAGGEPQTLHGPCGLLATRLFRSGRAKGLHREAARIGTQWEVFMFRILSASFYRSFANAHAVQATPSLSQVCQSRVRCTMVAACGEISSSNFNNGLCAAVIFCDIAKLRRQPGYGLRAPPNSIPRYDQPKGSMSADQIGRGWTDLQKFNVSASKQQFSFELSRRARIESPILEQVCVLCWQQSASFLQSWLSFTDYRTRGLRRVQDGP